MLPWMPEVHPSLDRPSPPSPSPSALATPIPAYTRHGQRIIPSDILSTMVLTPTDGGMRAQSSSLSNPVPERTTAPLPEPSTTPLIADQPTRVDPSEESPLPHPTMRENLLAFFGFGTDPKTQKFRSLIWNLVINGTQIIATIVLLAYSSQHASPQYPDVSEWRACNKPLGSWNSLWVAKVGFDCLILWWGHRREGSSRVVDGDVEAGTTRAQVSANPPRTVRHDRVVPPGETNETSSGLSRTDTHNNPDPSDSSLFSRLSVLLSILSFTWFITSNVFIYSSIDSCRFAAPHLWWLTFAILSITYLMLLEILFLGLIFFIIGPLVYLLWNLFLFLIGQHPLQHPAVIKPTVGKLSSAAVDKIPLVFYIPVPEDGESNPIPKPPPAHTYPPTPPKPKPVKWRFLFSRKKKPGESDSEHKGKDLNDSHSGDSWEDSWEKCEYPFVKLESNRAACVICLMDFCEPRRVGERLEEPKEDEGTKVGDAKDEASQQHGELRIEDAGEGPQPLRLFACGHVFHKTCIDPWLINVSGRCPTCQRPVETKDPEAKKRRNGRDQNLE